MASAPDEMERGEPSVLNPEYLQSEKPRSSNTIISTTSNEKNKDPHTIERKQIQNAQPKSLTNWLKLLQGMISKCPMWRPAIDTELIVRKFRDCPRGYSNLAVFLDSDDSFMLYRRFGFLQSRLILQKQDELRELEERLDDIDKTSSACDDGTLQSRKRDSVSNSPRVQLLTEIEKKFREYAKLIAAASTLVSLSKPTNRDYTSVRNYFETEKPLVESESEYIKCKEDLVTLQPGREHAWLDGFVERALQKFCCKPIQYIFCSAEIREKADEDTVLYTPSRINMLCTIIITCMILLLLIVPIYLLWHLSGARGSETNTAITIGTLLVCTLVFSAVLSFFTRAQRHEILGAAAAYCAVLVVFLSNFS